MQYGNGSKNQCVGISKKLNKITMVKKNINNVNSDKEIFV